MGGGVDSLFCNSYLFALCVSDEMIENSVSFQKSRRILALPPYYLEPPSDTSSAILLSTSRENFQNPSSNPCFRSRINASPFSLHRLVSTLYRPSRIESVTSSSAPHSPKRGRRPFCG